jgi:hypothetical protein
VPQCDHDNMDVLSHITLSASAPASGLERLPLPEHVQAVNIASKGITGLERIYLKTLHRNVSARKAFNLLQESTPQPTPSRVPIQGTRLSEHIELLKLENRREELQIFQHYMTELQNISAARPDVLGLKTIPSVQLGFLLHAQQNDRSEGGQAVDSFGGLFRRLEKAVISAKYRVEHEHALLNQAERVISTISVTETRKNRLCALAATRDELVAWIEDEISSSQLSEESMINQESQEQKAESTVPSLQVEVMTKYERYVTLRKRWLDCIVDCIAFAEHPQAEMAASETKCDSPSPSEQRPSLSYLPFLLTQIRNRTQLRQFHSQQAAHYSSLMAKECSKTTIELLRLADESHLLTAYPMLAQQERFKHAVTAIASKGLLVNAISGKEESEMSRRMKAWCFAADAAREATQAMVLEQLERSDEAVKGGERWIVKLRELHGDGDEAGHENSGIGNEESDQRDGEDDEDVWEAAAGRLTSSTQTTKGASCPWAGLQGDIGLKKDT